MLEADEKIRTKNMEILQWKFQFEEYLHFIFSK